MRNKQNLSVVELATEIEKIQRRLNSQGDNGRMDSGRRERLLMRLARLDNERRVMTLRERREKK